MKPAAQETQRQVRWVGKIDTESPTLGMAQLKGVRRAIVYKATPETGTYSHHGYIVSHNGILTAAWSNHARDEDASGQRVLMCRSTDDGKTWSHWVELFPPQDKIRLAEEQDDKVDRVLIPNGFAIVDGRLYAVAEEHVLEERRGLGRLARCIGDDGSFGEIFWLTENAPEPVARMPRHAEASDARFSTTVDKINEYLARPENLPSWEFVHRTCHPIAADGHKMCEPTQGWKLIDGTYVRLYRDLGMPQSAKNYAQFSLDGGITWTQPVQAEFPDACSRTAAGTLPDRTYYIINNPKKLCRDPLVISLSSDGLNFDRHAVIVSGAAPKRYEGRWKGHGFEYPRAAVHGDTFFVIYSICKEDVEIAAIPLGELSKV